MQTRKPERTASYTANETEITDAYLGLSEHSRSPQSERMRNEENMSLFWRVFGGTILSIIALVGVTLFNSMNNAIAELRTEVAKLNEARADAVKKDDYNTRMTLMMDRMQSAQGNIVANSATINAVNADILGLKDRLTKQSTNLETVRKELATGIDANRKDMLTATDAIKKDLATIELLKEKTIQITESLRLKQDEDKKLRQEVDRNQAADNERKAQRDAQYLKIDETIKELSKELLLCREKIARLEGVTGPAKPEVKK